MNIEIINLNNINNYYTNNIKTKEILSITKEFFLNSFIDLKLISSSFGETMLILNLKKDQRHKIRSKFDINKITSIFMKVNNKNTCYIDGKEHINENINNYDICITPYLDNLTLFDTKFYTSTQYLSPKGKTRSAIIFNSNFGIIPIHLSMLYNKIYSIDNDLNSYKISKLNLRTNNVNNVLSYNSNFNTWINNYNNKKYMIPGKKSIIGNLVINNSDFNDEFKSFILNINPETILLYSKLDFETTIDNFIVTKTTDNKDFYIKKYKMDKNLDG